jgi:hypothetical protein
MLVAIVGSRSLSPDDKAIARHLPGDTTGIISGGAIGVDRAAAQYARSHNLTLREFLPDYEIYGRRAPLVRNQSIVDQADYLLAFWDGKSKGTAHTIGIAKKKGIPIKIVRRK